MNETRGQAHTLEAIVAGVVLISSLVFALQVTAVTPLSASTASQHIENQQQASATGALATAADRGALRRAVLYWNDTGDTGRFHDPDHNNYYSNEAPPNEFGDVLRGAFEGRGLAYNVFVVHDDADSDREERQRMVYRGEASDHAVTVGWTVTIYDSDLLYDEDERETDTTVSSTGSFYAEDTAPDSIVYNVVRVEVVVWRM